MTVFAPIIHLLHRKNRYFFHVQLLIAFYFIQLSIIFRSMSRSVLTYTRIKIERLLPIRSDAHGYEIPGLLANFVHNVCRKEYIDNCDPSLWRVSRSLCKLESLSV